MPAATTAVRMETTSLLPAAATISGEGVSPAATVAASGSPPGNAAAAARADAGLAAGSRERQRMIARSISGVEISHHRRWRHELPVVVLLDELGDAFRFEGPLAR